MKSLIHCLILHISFGARVPSWQLLNKPLVKDHNEVDPDNSWEDAKCATATDRLDQGPSSPDDFSPSNKFTDQSFDGNEMLYWEGFSTGYSDPW